MRKVIVEIAVSLDGFIEGPNGELDWIIPITVGMDEDLCVSHFVKGFDTIFYGRNAYEKFGFPRPEDSSQSQGEREFNAMVNNTRKYVFSRTVKHVEGNGMVIGDNLVAEVNRIKDEIGKNIWVCGGANIINALANLSLIDEYVFAVQPIILGAGKPLFHHSNKRQNLKLIRSKSLKAGVTILHYQTENLPTKLKSIYDRSFQNQC